MIGEKSFAEISKTQASVPRAMRRVADWVADRIYTRTRVEGIGLSGLPFRPYSAAYAKKKGVGMQDVDLYSNEFVRGGSLRESGSTHMLDAIYVEDGPLPDFNIAAGRFINNAGQFVSFARALNGHTETISISPSAPADVQARASHHNLDRPWFGLSDDDRANAYSLFKRELIRPNSTTNETRITIGA